MIPATVRTYRNAYSGLSRETWLLSLIMLINRSGTMVVPFMTLYLTTEMGFSISRAGFVFALFGLGAFSGAWMGGKLTDRMGFYPVQWASLLGGGLLFIALGQMRSFPSICIFTFLLSFINESFRPANSTAIAFYSKEENRTRSYALNRLAINLGWAVGSGIGGVLAHINYELLFWVDGCTNITAAILIWAVLKPPAVSPHHTEENKPSAVTLPAYRDKKFLGFILITVVFASCFFQLFTNIPVFFKKEMHLSEPFIGFIMALNGITIGLLEMVFVYKMEGRRKNLSLITIGVLLIGIAFVLLNLPFYAPTLALGMILITTVGEICSLPFMNTYWISRTQLSNRGQYAALYTMAWSAAQTIGPLAGAQLADHWGFTVLWFLVGGLCILAAFLFQQLE